MAILEVIGTSNPVQQSVVKRWAYTTGETQTTTYRGVYAGVASLYDQFKAVAGYAPSIDSLDITYQRGQGVLTVNQVQDGEIMYELLGNEVNVPVWHHPYFAALSGVNVDEVRRTFERGEVLGVNPYVPAAEPYHTLYEMLAYGYETYLRSAYVLRSSQIVSKRSTVQAAYTGVNTVQAPPDTQNVNSLIGALPPGEWLYKTPQVRMYGAKKWQMQREWWWAEGWSTILYGGTKSP